MKIWDDGDTCPVAIEEINLRAAERLPGKQQNLCQPNGLVSIPIDIKNA